MSLFFDKILSEVEDEGLHLLYTPLEADLNLVHLLLDHLAPLYLSLGSLPFHFLRSHIRAIFIDTRQA